MRVIAFVNPGSGGNKGARVAEKLEEILGSDNVFDIIADRGPKAGLTSRASDDTEDVRCIVAGGDGTFSWVATTVEQLNLRHVRLIIIPLGSGNDMARALGWGKKYPGHKRIHEYVDWLRKAPSNTLDVWRLVATEDEAKVNAAPTVSADGVEHSARPLVCNYLSLGADAYVELKFNQLRWERPEKYKSRLGNFKAHVMVGTKYMLRSRAKKIFVHEHIETLIVDGNEIQVPTHLQAIIFLNIPSYGAGTQPWGFPRANQSDDLNLSRPVESMFVNDNRFEVIGLRSLPHYGRIRMLGCSGVRIAQGQSLRITLKSDATPFQVDGEPWEQRGGVITLEKGNSVGVLVGPIWRNESKKNAKFTASSEDNSSAAGEEQPETSGNDKEIVHELVADDSEESLALTEDSQS